MGLAVQKSIPLSNSIFLLVVWYMLPTTKQHCALRRKTRKQYCAVDVKKHLDLGQVQIQPRVPNITLVTTYLSTQMFPGFEQTQYRLTRCEIRSLHFTMPPCPTDGRWHPTPHTHSPASPLLSVLRHSPGVSHMVFFLKWAENTLLWFSLRKTSPFLTFVVYKHNSAAVEVLKREGGSHVIVVLTRLAHTNWRLLKSSTWCIVMQIDDRLTVWDVQRLGAVRISGSTHLELLARVFANHSVL
jgi:hypothetical protein